MSRKNWTADDIEQLREGWGCHGGLPKLAAKMGRSVDSLKVKAVRLGLGPWLDAQDYITLHQLICLLRGGAKPESGYSYTRMRLERMGLRTRRKRVKDDCFLVVDIDDFWSVAEKHQRELDFSRLEENILGMEPDWVKEKRRQDKLNRRLHYPKNTPWSPQEDNTLRQAVENGATYADLQGMFRRTSGAIRRRILHLGLSKPVRATIRPWSESDLDKLSHLRAAGWSLDRIARELGRSPEAVRGKLENLKGLSCGRDRYQRSSAPQIGQQPLTGTTSSSQLVQGTVSPINTGVL